MAFVKRRLLMLSVTSDQHGLRNHMETFDGYLPLAATGYRTLPQIIFSLITPSYLTLMIILSAAKA